MFKIIILLGVVIFILLLYIIKLKVQLETEKKKLIDTKCDYLHYKNKLSMVEYEYRKYKEGCNGFTVLRNISNIIKDFYLGDTNNE